MTNIANLLKAEINRVAAKQARAETQGIKKAVAPYRSEIASLKRRVLSLETSVRRMSKVQRKEQEAVPPQPDARQTRFSAKSLASQRKRLGLSARECAQLIGVSDQSIYKWEEGKARPRSVALEKVVALRALSKKEARELLVALVPR